MPKIKPNEKQKRDRLAARIMAAMDRALASPHAVRDTKGGGAVAECVAGMILEGQPDLLMRWPREALRGVMLAYATHAPTDWLEMYARRADAQRAWCDEWDGQQAAIATLVAAGMTEHEAERAVEKRGAVAS